MPVCTPCGRSFIDNNALLMHTNSKHPPKYECSRCNRAFKTSEGRDQHEKSKHPPKYECSRCNRAFKTSEGRVQHEESKHPGYECSYCDRTFTTSNGRDQHEEAKHPDFECLHCDSTFTTSEGRDQHQRVKHSFRCTLCDRDFPSQGALDQHDEIAHSIYECRYCDKEFLTAASRAQHENTKHKCLSTDYSSSYRLRLRVSSSLVQPTVSKPAPVEQPRLNAVLEALPTQEPTLAPPDGCNEEICEGYSENDGDYGEETCDGYSEEIDWDHREETCDGYSEEIDWDHSEENDDDDNEEDYDNNSEDNGDDDDEEVYDDDSEENYDDDNEENYDDGGEETYDDDGEETYDGQSDGPSEGHSDVSITQSSKSHITVPEPVANFACKICGEKFATILAMRDHEISGHVESCACQICKRAGWPCSCGICKRASGLTVLIGDGKPLVNIEPEATAPSVDSPEVIGPEVIEDSPLEFCNSIVTVELREPVHPLLDGLRDVAEDTVASQNEQTLLDMEHVVDGKPSTGLTSSHPPLSLGNDNDGLDYSECQINGFDLEEGVTSNSTRLESHPVPCETDTLEQHATDATPFNAGPVILSPIGEGHTYFSDHNPLIDTINSKTGGYNVVPAEACNDQQAIPHADSKPQLISDPPPWFNLCVPELGHDDPSSLPIEPLASGTFSLVDTIPVSYHSLQLTTLPQVCAAKLESPELDDPSTSDLVPSPTPSEQGSLRPISIIQESHTLESHPPLSPSTSEGSADYFSDINHPSTPSSPLSGHSIVFVSAESIPEYLRENRAYLVATSAPSRPSSAASSYVRLPSVATSMDSMSPEEGPDFSEAPLAEHVPTNNPSRLYCRVCLRDPCDDLTATMCGHVFCNRCIVDIVMARSACPVCNAPTLLYCLFRLDI